MMKLAKSSIKWLYFPPIKKSQNSDSIIIRIFNPTEKTQEGKLSFAVPLVKAWYTNLNEKRT